MRRSGVAPAQEPNHDPDDLRINQAVSTIIGSIAPNIPHYTTRCWPPQGDLRVQSAIGNWQSKMQWQLRPEIALL
jgi:hypothetical protein